MQKNNTRRLVYCAVCVAVSVVGMVVSHFTTLRMPLLVCSICCFVCLQKSGLVLGVLGAVCAVLIVLAMGFLGTALLAVIVFVPLGVIGYFTKSLSYKKLGHAALRVGISVVFGNVALVCLYFFARLILPEIDFDALIQKLGSYVVLAILASLIAIFTDFLFYQACITIKKLLK